MTCEKAESYLSAYLDDMLDPQLRQDVAAHVESCAHCAEVLADYRRGDALLAGTPRVTPADTLRDRIFRSPEFAAILREQSRSGGGRTSVPLLDRPTGTGTSSDAPGVSAMPTPLRTGHRGSSPPWRRVALQSAAVLALLLGSALLIKQGLLHSSGTTGHGPQTIGGHGSVQPLAAGPRAVYEHGGALWSAPENGPDLAQQLTPKGVRVAGWAVSPDGRSIAYVNAADGSIHVIRSDDQNDHTIGASTSGGALPAGFWSSKAGESVAAGLSWSPDGKHLAFVAADGSGQTVLHVVSATGSNNTAMGSAATWTSSAVWSASSTQLAFVQSDAAGGQAITVYDAASHQVYHLSAADPAVGSASVAHMAWLAGTLEPTLTWDAVQGSTITGVFAQPAVSGTAATRLAPAGARYTAADFTSAQGANLWMVASADTLTTLAVDTAGQTGVTTQVGVTATRIVWAPSGATAAYVTEDGQLGLWTPGAAPIAIPIHVVGTPVWSRDSARLAVQASDGVMSLRVANGTVQSLTRLANVSRIVELSWSPDGQALAIGSASGVLIADNGTVTAPDGTALDASAIAWTIAG